jgi:septum formation protein
VDEELGTELSPCEAVIELANRKASAVAERLSAEAKANKNQEQIIVIGADTIVVSDGKLLNKPVSEEDAIAMLSSLSDKAHEVYTGLALILIENGRANTALNRYVVSKVHFRKLDPAEIRAYVASGEPMDKAGAYALQGNAAAFVQSIDGCYTNIIGMPMPDLVAMLRALGVKVLGC